MPITLEQKSASDARRVIVRRAQVERLLDLAQHLPRRDRLLVQQVLRHGIPITDLARLLGVHPRLLQRRIRSIMLRLRDPMFAKALDRQLLLPREIAPVAHAVILRGQSLRQAARHLGLSLHAVRRHLDLARQILAD